MDLEPRLKSALSCVVLCVCFLFCFVLFCLFCFVCFLTKKKTIKLIVPSSKSMDLISLL